MKDYITVTAIELTADPVYKTVSYSSSRPTFAQNVTYTLVDGRKIPTTVTAERKKNLPARIESAQRSAAAGALSVTLNPDGTIGSTCTAWTV